MARLALLAALLVFSPSIAQAQPVWSSTVTLPLDARGIEVGTGVDAGDVFLFTPRLVLFPVRLASAVIYFPVQEGLRFIERHALIDRAIDLLYNDERTAAIIPYVTASTSQGFAGGVKAFHSDLFGHQESGSIRARLGRRFARSFELELEADRFGGTYLWLETQLRYDIEPDRFFFGIGSTSVETRFLEERVLGRVRLGVSYGELGERIKLGGSLIFNRRRFGAGEDLSSDQRSIETVYDTAQIPGFRGGIDLFETTADLILDFRDRAGRTSSGVFVEAFAGGVPPQGEYAYAHWGLEAVVYFDLYRESRVLALRAALEAVEGDETKIPFTSLPRLGGVHRLRGYRIDTFRDEKAALATLEYRYPIHKNVAGLLFVDLGHTGRNYRELLRGDWRVGAGGGLILSSNNSTLLKLDVSYGDGLHVFVSTEPLRAFRGRFDDL